MKQLEVGCLAIVLASGRFTGRTVTCVARVETDEKVLIELDGEVTERQARRTTWICELHKLSYIEEMCMPLITTRFGLDGNCAFNPTELLRIDDLEDVEKERELDEIY